MFRKVFNLNDGGFKPHLNPRARYHPQFRRHHTVVAYIKKNIPETASILDVGCGGGFLAEVLYSIGYTNISGCDWQEASMHFPDPENYHQIDLNADVLSQLYGDRKFDLIISSDVMEHLENPARFLRMIFDQLSPQGTVILTLPNPHNILQRLIFLFSGESTRYRVEAKDEFGHISFFTKSILTSLSQRANLSIQCYFGGPIYQKGFISEKDYSELFSFSYGIVLRKITTEKPDY